ncbi:SurA N-terminal domain-containing protein, partial [bacterium]|nr:SurA N-terminal domain-containing protein [bacterium]
MLRILRKKMRGILIATIVLIIPAFIGFYGVGRYRGRQSRTAVVAKVNGQKIDYRQFHDAYQGVKRRWQSLYRNHWDEQMEGQLKKEALEELIREILLPREAKRRRIVVTDQEVFDQISSIPGLHKEGKFDKALYLRVLSYKGLSPERFEAQMREDLMVKKLRSQVTEEVEISEEELKEEYIKRNEKVRVKYILFKKEDFKKDLKMEEKELKDYLQENLEEFKVPEKVNVQYVLIDPREREGEVEIDEDEISSYYQENIEDFKHLEEEGEAHTAPLEEVRSQIQATLKAKRADEVAREEAEDLASELLDKTDWERMVKE